MVVISGVVLIRSPSIMVEILPKMLLEISQVSPIMLRFLPIMLTLITPVSYVYT